tara:strand:- start:79674 stop:80507 length:834 start_codon:yes stop_codon:yes gene_type:complete
MDKPTVSVCMIAYNHGAYIAEAIAGVLMQKTNFTVEVVISNDASSDNTQNIINELAVDTETIKFRVFDHTDNLGMMPNFIFTLKACRGKYIALCEGDDYWTDPLKLQKQVDFLEANRKYAGCFHNTDMIDESDPTSQLKPWRTFNKEVFTLRDTIAKTSLFHTSSFVFRTELLEIPDWFKKIQSGDMALFSIIASKGPLFRIDDAMSVYRKNEGGITSSISLINYHDKRKLLFKFLKSYCTNEVHSEIDIIIAHHTQKLKKLKKSALKERIKNLLKN